MMTLKYLRSILAGTKKKFRKFNQNRNCPFCKQVMVSLESFFLRIQSVSKKLPFHSLFVFSDDFLLHIQPLCSWRSKKFIVFVKKNFSYTNKKIAHFFSVQKKDFWCERWKVKCREKINSNRQNRDEKKIIKGVREIFSWIFSASGQQIEIF